MPAKKSRGSWSFHGSLGYGGFPRPAPTQATSTASIDEGRVVVPDGGSLAAMPTCAR